MKQTVSPNHQRVAVKAVLIDLDGTLIDSAPEIARAANAMLAELQFEPLPLKTVQSYIGEGALALIKRCLKTVTSQEPDAALLATAKTHFFSAYQTLAPQSKPFDNAEAGLHALKALDIPIACVTNKPAQFTQPMLEATGLDHYFNTVVSGDTLSKKKPAPDQILHICQQFTLKPNEVVLIGDSNTDILAAKNAGCYVFTVPYGYNQGLAIDASQVDATISDLKDAINYIQQ